MMAAVFRQGKVRFARKWLLMLLLPALAIVSGCSTFKFYTQAIHGQYEIFAHQKSVEKLIADPQTPADLKKQLELVQELRAFAKTELKLPVDGHYRRYADVHRQYVVWNVEAAPEFSLEAKTWWYPLVGSLEYRGYFSERGASNYVACLQKKGWDVYVDGVEAYSTLCWFKDPLLNTFVFRPAPELAEILFHELGHQRVFARGDTDFNEAYATTVGQEGARRWLLARGDKEAYEKYTAAIRRNEQFVRLIQNARERLGKIYGDELDGNGNVKAGKKTRSVSPEQLRAEKQQVFDDLRRDYEKLKKMWDGHAEYDEWFAAELNNAQLNSVAAYYDFVPAFERLLEMNGGDLEKFYQAVERLAEKSKEQRHQQLKMLGTAAPDLPTP